MATKTFDDLTLVSTPAETDIIPCSQSTVNKKMTTLQLINTFKGVASRLASLDSSTKVVENPANATATATASKIPIADGSAKLDTWISDASSTVKGKVELATDAETITGTDTARATTPANIAATSIAKVLLDAKGDLIVATAADTPARLAVGTNGQVLIAASGETTGLKWGAGGRVVQVVNVETGALATGSTAIPYDDTIPQNTEGTEFMTLAITPTSATNKLKIEVTAFIAHNSAAANITNALFQDSTANALAAAGYRTGGDGWPLTITFTHYMTAGTTSGTTFKLRIGTDNGATISFNGGGGVRFYGGVAASSITITEISV